MPPRKGSKQKTEKRTRSTQGNAINNENDIKQVKLSKDRAADYGVTSERRNDSQTVQKPAKRKRGDDKKGNPVPKGETELSRDNKGNINVSKTPGGETSEHNEETNKKGRKRITQSSGKSKDEPKAKKGRRKQAETVEIQRSAKRTRTKKALDTVVDESTIESKIMKEEQTETTGDVKTEAVPENDTKNLSVSAENNKKNLSVTINNDNDVDDVGVMSSTDDDDDDDDDDFEPVTKKLKVPLQTNRVERRSTKDRKSVVKESLPISQNVIEKTKKKPVGKAQKKSKDNVNLGTKIKNTRQSKTSSSKKEKTNKHSHDSATESQTPVITKTCPTKSVHSKKATNCHGNAQKIDQSDVMSVLLHMEGGSDMAGPSVPCSRDSGGEEGSVEDSEEDSDWEEVKDLGGSPQKSQIPKDPVEVILEAPNFLKKRKKKGFDWKAYVQRQINRFNKELTEDIHKVHLMCLLMRGRYLNQVCNNPVLRGVALSLVPSEMSKVTVKKFDVSAHTRLMNWFREAVSIDLQLAEDAQSNLVQSLIKGMETRKVASPLEYVLVYLIMIQCLGVRARLVTSLQPLPLKNTKKVENTKKINIKGNPAAIKKPIKSKSDSKAERMLDTKSKKKGTTGKKPERERKKQKASKPDSVSHTSSTLKTKNKNLRKRGSKVRPDSYHDNSDVNDSDEDFEPENVSESEPEVDDCRKRKKKSFSNSVKSSQSPDRSDEDSDFMEEMVQFRSPVRKPQSGEKKNRKVLSSDSENESTASNHGCDEWVEVFIEAEKSWICIDCIRGHVNRPYRIESAATQPVHYVVAYNEEGEWKDVTARYACKWMTETRKLRVDPEWWSETLGVFRCEEDSTEDEEIKANLMKRPLPTSVSAYKSHPLYALRRHLLKYEAIYPETAAPLGYIRGEPVYARECVHELHSRENWLKEGRAVRIGEEAYKMVKSRAKWNKPKVDPEALDLELFGLWQTEEYIPPPAVDGKVPRNAYGNIELFKPSMLPAGTVYLKVPGLNKVAKKLNMDCVPAMVGWDSHCGFSHPVLEGFVVCEEHKDILLAAWDEEQEIQKQKEAEKKEKRAVGNWKLLIKGLLIKERIKKRFNLMEKDEEQDTKQKPKGKIATDAEKSWPRKHQQSKKLSHSQETM